MLRRKYAAALLCGVFLLLGAGEAQAIEKVKIGAMHMCCPVCEKTIYDALKKVKGVTDAKVLRSANQVTFTGSDRAAAEAGVAALLKQGYWGDFKINSEEYKPKYDPIEAGQKFDLIVFDEVHICCNACGESIGNTVAIGNPKGLEEDQNDFNRTAKTATFHGKGMDPAELFQLMHNAGFHGKFNPTKSKKAE